jgi:hypothetical protein
VNTELTVQLAASLLSEFTGPDFVKNLNLVRQRYVLSGLWKGILNRSDYNLPAGQGYFTLSRGDESIVGIDICCRPMMVMNQWFEFNPVGIGYMPEDKRGCGPVIDMGDGFVVQKDISENCTLRLKLEDATDAGKTVRLFGLDEDGREIYDSNGFKGITLTTASPSSDTTQVFSRITGLQFPFMVGYSTLWQVVSGVETQIGVYAPGEMTPCYRRYKTGILNQDEGVTLRTFCRQRFVPVAAATDYVIPGNVGALKWGFLALKHEDAGRIEEADASWARGEKLLNEELAALRGSAITTLRLLGNDTMQGYGWLGNGFGGGYGYGAGTVN